MTNNLAGKPSPGESFSTTKQRKARPLSFWFALILGGLFLLSLLFNLILLGVLVASSISRGVAVESGYREFFRMGEKHASDKILLIPVQGAIFSGSGSSGLWGSSFNIVKAVHDALRMAADDKQIKALIFEINSPGGSITACHQIHTEILRFKQKRPNVPIIVTMGDVAASGGYYIAAPADKIIAHPTTITGSIGVISHFLNIEELCKKIGLKEEIIKSGPYKDIGSIFRPMSDKERAAFQEIIKEMYKRFIQVVADGRKDLTAEQIRALANGMIYTGQQALEHGLIDGLGDLTDAVREAKKVAHLTKAKVIEYRKPHNLLRDILFSVRKEANISFRLEGLIEKLVWEANTPRLLYMWKYDSRN